MSTHYVAVIEKEPDSAFGVWFPDVEGCFSAGETVDEAVGECSLQPFVSMSKPSRVQVGCAGGAFHR